MDFSFLTDSKFWPEFIFTLIIGDLILTIIGVLIADRIKAWLQQREHGGWIVRISDQDTVKAEFPVSAEKQMEIQEDTAERDVFLKGRTSVHAWLNTEVAALLEVDEQNRIYSVDLAKNPPKAAPPPSKLILTKGDEKIELLNINNKTIILDLDEISQLIPENDPNEID